ncbi:alpha/beta hydrolase-fold protein [Corynebacterium tapiri]|uniref:Trehalose O-mycolyltransferase n=1 Tax=Corynebacterium tapiri TaxID=1448266 RepID=A0A5C4U2J1_9CORY|nr:alpha/beta hydrolase-fold protein [Corynebacterium tapiri]TNL95583.1 hypothetical protein FHE74_09480 [Corynebacterium tapiri]
MRENTRSPRFMSRRFRLGLLAVPTAMALGASIVPQVATAQGLGGLSSGSSLSDGVAPSDPPVRTPLETTHPKVEGLPAGVSIDRVEWLSDRHIAIFINSAAMPGEPIEVQMLLARDWRSQPNKKFPEVWALDGLRARDDENGWTIETNIEQQFATRNVNVILPVGGESSFYSDWQQPDNGKHYKWESFLTKELVPILDKEFKSNGKRAVVGLSMGGTSAMNLAERNPHLFNFVGSFSGYLDTTSTGMPAAIAAAMRDAGNYDATKMWGPFGSQDWIDHDPKLGLEGLKNMGIYVSAGSGRDDFGVAESVAKQPANAAGIGLEVISRLTTQTFVDEARAAGLNPTVKFRPSGVHSWEYWQFELSEAWPMMADSLGLSKEDRGLECSTIGMIAEATQSGVIGNCITNEYDVADQRGKAQDFTGGTAYWSPETNAHALFGDINARYAGIGGPSSWLGFPKSGEQKTPDGNGRYVHFEHGSIYWTPETKAHAIPGPLFEEWGKQGFEKGWLGYPTGEVKDVARGQVQQFQGGQVIKRPDNKTAFVNGAIADKYAEIGGVESGLGFPTANAIEIPGGVFQQFDHGNIYFSEATGAHVIYYGDLFEAWGKKKYEQGEFGWPTSDMKDIPAGGKRIEFQHGVIEQINGQVREEKR